MLSRKFPLVSSCLLVSHLWMATGMSQWVCRGTLILVRCPPHDPVPSDRWESGFRRKQTDLDPQRREQGRGCPTTSCCCCVASVVSDSVRPHRRQPTRLPPSLGSSRQEYSSGLPFPSPMHESEKWKWSRSVASDSSRPHGLQPTRLLRPWDFPGKSTGVGCHCLLRAVWP